MKVNLEVTTDYIPFTLEAGDIKTLGDLSKLARTIDARVKLIRKCLPKLATCKLHKLRIVTE